MIAFKTHLRFSQLAAFLVAGCSGMPGQQLGWTTATQPARTRGEELPELKIAASEVRNQRAWMLPSAKSARKLLYVSDWSTDAVYVYNYSTGSHVGTLTGFDSPYGQCVDKKGDVWVTNYGGGGSAVEYPHGGSEAIKTLATDGKSVGCSIDPTTGNLAVANIATSGGPADLLVFEHASGKLTTYTDDWCYYSMWSPGYDRKGNLYVEGDDSGAYVCELANGASSMRGPVTISGLTLNYAGGVMWDGKYLTLTDQEFHASDQTGIYRVSEDASGNLTEVSATVLNDNCDGDYSDIPQPFIVGTKNTPQNKSEGTAVIGGNLSCQSRFDRWNYPRGGSPISSLKSAPTDPRGESVSILK